MWRAISGQTDCHCVMVRTIGNDVVLASIFSDLLFRWTTIRTCSRYYLRYEIKPDHLQYCTVKPVYVVTSIKHSSVLNSDLFVVIEYFLSILHLSRSHLSYKATCLCQVSLNIILHNISRTKDNCLKYVGSNMYY
jgi:hypothetical protein